MKYEYVEEIRKVLVDELKDYEGEPVLLDIDESVLSQVIFNNYGDVKIFAPEVYSILNKINFSNVCFDNVCVSEVNFSNCVGVKLHPQTIANQDLRRSTLSGVEIIGPFDGVNIAYTNFKGSKGAIINPQTVKDKYLVSCIFNGVEFDGPFDNCVIRYSDFTGSKGALIDQTKLRKTNDREMSFSRLFGCNLRDAYVVDNLTENDYSYAKVDGAHMISVKIDEEKEQKEYCIRKIRSIVRKNNNSTNK